MKPEFKKIFLFSLFLLEFGAVNFSQSLIDIELNSDSLKTEIKRFENQIFELPVDTSIDSTIIYVSVFSIKSSSKIKAHGQAKRKKSFSYFIMENDSMSLSKLEKRNDKRIFKDYHIEIRDNTFEKFKNHSLFRYNRYIVGLGKEYLVVRDAWLSATTDSRQTGPSYFTERYIFYERIN